MENSKEIFLIFYGSRNFSTFPSFEPAWCRGIFWNKGMYISQISILSWRSPVDCLNLGTALVKFCRTTYLIGNDHSLHSSRAQEMDNFYFVNWSNRHTDKHKVFTELRQTSSSLNNFYDWVHSKTAELVPDQTQQWKHTQAWRIHTLFGTVDQIKNFTKNDVASISCVGFAVIIQIHIRMDRYRSPMDSNFVMPHVSFEER